ncbi:MAG: antibiotic biosynthesis monooxygenase [Acidobacteria bacterium]|nr:antibiotic biosynthesis monooxygenase [Acidobacteriota bacterium]
MLVRMFQFRVKKGRGRAVQTFMRGRPLGWLKRVPGCLCAYFTRGKRKDEYVWVTVWTSEGAVKKAMARRDLQALVAEETERFFAGKPEVTHYQVLVAK